MLISLDNFDISTTAIFKKNEFNHNFHFIAQKYTENNKKKKHKKKTNTWGTYYHKMKRSDLKKKKLLVFSFYNICTRHIFMTEHTALSKYHKYVIKN